MANKAQVGPLSEGYERMLMMAENAPLLASMAAGGVDGKPPALNGLRHKSPERGYDTAGFGHKMTKAEHNSGFINGKRIEDFKPVDLMEMFRKDQEKVMIWLKKNLRSMGIDHSKWTRRKLEAAFDIQYNVKGGIKTYPKFVKALDAGDWKTAQAESGRFYTVDGEKKPMQGRMDLWNAQFMGSQAAKSYGSAAAEKETAHVMDQQRIQRVDAATPATLKREEQRVEAQELRKEATSAATASPEEIDAMEAGAINNIRNSGVPAASPNAPSGYAAGSAPAGIPLVPTPAPDIDLGGMLSKEYTNPATGGKGDLGKGLLG